jgi:hypothetical protein
LSYIKGVKMAEQATFFNAAQTAAPTVAPEAAQFVGAPQVNEATAAPTAAPVQQAPAAPAPEQEAASDEAVELTVNDLGAIKQIIDVASARGAFRPAEMVSIGTIYTRLEKFLTAVASQQKTENPNA